MQRNNIFRGLIISGLFISSINFSGCNSAVEANNKTDAGEQSITALTIAEFPFEELNQGEIDGLIFMREEEKLARDVYITLYNTWGKRVFNNISKAEQTHMNALKLLIDKYELTDPVGVDSMGVFQNELLQGLFNSLTEQGSISLEEALRVGALIEEIDILDIQKELTEHVDNQDLSFVYENLIRGSRNHLRAFVKNLSRMGITYEPLKLTMEQYLTIINGDWERGRP